MKISELEKQLDQIKKEHGDCTVMIWETENTLTGIDLSMTTDKKIVCVSGRKI